MIPVTHAGTWKSQASKIFRTKNVLDNINRRYQFGISSRETERTEFMRLKENVKEYHRKKWKIKPLKNLRMREKRNQGSRLMRSKR